MLRMTAGCSCLALFILLLACESWAQPAQPLRAEVALDDWRFQPGTLGVEPVAADWAPVRLPYTWTSTWLRPKASETTSWAKRDLRDVNSGWYEADVTVPAAWAGRRVLLDLRGIQCDAVVWVAGKPVGEVKGPDGRVDLTAVAAPGSSPRLRIWVTRWWEGTENQRSGDLFRDLTLQSLSHSEWYHSEDEARRAIPGGIGGGVSLLALPAAGEVSHVSVATSVRRHELRVSLDYTLLAAAPGAQFAVQVAQTDGATAGLPAGMVPVEDTSGDGKPRSQSLTLPWADPHLWDVGAPYLYRLQVVLVGADGQALDALAPVRFGFREVWAEGRELILNGHPLHLRPSYFVQSVNAMLFFEGMGFNTIALQPNPSSWYGAWGLFPGGSLQGGNTQALLDAADERGWAVLMPVPGVSTLRDALLKPEAEAPYLRDLRMWLAALDRGNRPSILMWTPSMNTSSVSSPEKVGRIPTTRQPGWYAKVEELIRSVDPTRLIYHHQGGQTGDVQTSNIYLNWVPLAEQEEYLSAWSRDGQRPWGGIEHGAPLSMDYFKRACVPLYTEYGAISLGDAAYALEKDDYVTASVRAQETPGAKTAFDGVRAFRAAGGFATIGDGAPFYPVASQVIRGVNKSWRAWGLNGGIFPWFFDVGFGAPPGYKPGNMGYLYETLTGTPEELHQRPAWANPLYDAYRDTMQPLLVYLGGPAARFTAVEPRYTAGESAERSIVAVWDGPGDRSFTASWELQVGGKAALTGAESFRMTAGAIEKRPLRFTVPPVNGRTDALLKLTVRDAAGAELARDEVALAFFPPQPAAPPPLMARWGVYDPSGRTATDWAQAGLRARTVTLGDSLQDLDVLVIGADALKDAPRLPFTAADVSRGLRVLVLEQGLAALEALGFRAQDVVPRQVFPRVADHPALAGLTADDLCDWRGAGQLLPPTSAGMRVWPWPHGPHCGNTGSVASVVMETPHRGAFTPLLECEFDLAYTPLLSWRHGTGEVLFSQLDFTGRLGAEPAAGILARNLVRYLDAAPAVQQTKEALLLGDGAAGKSFLAELGFRWRPADAAALAALDPAGQVVVVGPGDAPAASQSQRALADFVAAGGTVLFLPQDAAALSRAGLPWALPLTDARAARVTAEAMGEDPLLRGVGPQLVHWRSFLEGATFAAEGLPDGARRLLDGWLLRVPSGAGGWVFAQVDWRRLEDGTDNLRRTRWNVRKLYCELLTNLGVGTEDASAGQMLAARTVAPMVNINAWQVLQQAPPFEPTVAANNTLPGLGAELAAERWVQNPVAETRRDFTWRLRAADANGRVDFTHVATAKVGLAGYAVTHIFSSAPRTATLAVSADYWLVFKLNSAPVVDQSAEPRPGVAPRPGELRLRVPLQAGWNRLEARVGSGSGGFGFWCQISDPGDLRVSPTLTAPEGGAAPVPAADLRPEPLVAGPNLLYAEALQKEDDPYGFSPW